MLGLALDEPHETDRRLLVQGLPFLIDGALLGGLQRHLPLRVDHDPGFWRPLRIYTSRPGHGQG